MASIYAAFSNTSAERFITVARPRTLQAYWRPSGVPVTGACACDGLTVALCPGHGVNLHLSNTATVALVEDALPVYDAKL